MAKTILSILFGILIGVIYYRMLLYTNGVDDILYACFVSLLFMNWLEHVNESN